MVGSCGRERDDACARGRPDVVVVMVPLTNGGHRSRPVVSVQLGGVPDVSGRRARAGCVPATNHPTRIPGGCRLGSPTVRTLPAGFAGSGVLVAQRVLWRQCGPRQGAITHASAHVGSLRFRWRDPFASKHYHRHVLGSSWTFRADGAHSRVVTGTRFRTADQVRSAADRARGRAAVHGEAG